MEKFKLAIREASFLLFLKKYEVEVNSTGFYEAELSKLNMFDKQF
jgi:hypothetical protein